MKKSKMLALSTVFAVGVAFSSVSSADSVDINSHAAVWSTAAVGMSGDIVSSIVANQATDNSVSAFSVPPAFWLLGTAMIFLLRKPHNS